MKYLIAIVCLIIISTPQTHAQGDIDSDMDIFSQSIATVNDISSGFINPACLSQGPIMALRYLHATTDSTFKGDDGFLLATRGNLVSVQWLRHTNNISRRKFLFAGGKQLFPKFYWGISIAYFNGNEVYKEKKVWKLGILSTPTPYINLAAVIDDINQPKFDGHKVRRLYIVGAAIKANFCKMKLSADGWMRENNNLDDVEAKFRLEFTFNKKLKLAAHYLTEGAFQIGIGYNIGHIGVGFGGNLNQDEFHSGNFYYNQLPVGSQGR